MSLSNNNKSGQPILAALGVIYPDLAERLG
jgi:hypothetical protein